MTETIYIIFSVIFLIMVLVSFIIVSLTSKPIFIISAIFFMVCLIVCLWKWPDEPGKIYKRIDIPPSPVLGLDTSN